MHSQTRLMFATSATTALLTAALFLSFDALADNNPATTSLDAPYVVPYNGVLEWNGSPLDGTIDMRFSLYEDQVTDAAQWTEEYSVDGDSGGGVVANNGTFNVLLGSHVALDTAILDAEVLYVGIEVRDTGASPDWIALANRQRIGMVPYAMWSGESSNLHVAGAADVDGTLNVDGAVTADNIGSSDSTTNFTNGVNVAGDARVNGLVVNSASGGAVPTWLDEANTHGMRIHAGSDNTFFGIRQRTAGNDNAYDSVVYFGDDTDDDLVFTTQDNGDIITFQGDGNATFNGNITVNGDITNLSVSGTYDASRNNVSGTSTTTMVSTTDSFCFLTSVQFEDVDSTSESVRCRVTTSGSNWVLQAYNQASGDSDAWCQARCLSW